MTHEQNINDLRNFYNLLLVFRRNREDRVKYLTFVGQGYREFL